MTELFSVDALEAQHDQRPAWVLAGEAGEVRDDRLGVAVERDLPERSNIAFDSSPSRSS